MLKLMLLTTDARTIRDAEAAGVDRIFFDLEYINKVDRQLGRNTHISHNSLEGIDHIRSLVHDAELLVRVNPIYPGSVAEIDRVVSGGADIIMLPMVLDANDAQTFVQVIRGRSRTCLLLETAQALTRLDDILVVPGVDEIYIGLNDLHISLGLSFMFEPLSGGIIDYMAQKIRAADLQFGFGGMAKIGEGILPAEAILAEHYRLGSSSVILSRSFRNEVGSGEVPIDMAHEIAKIREMESMYASWSDEAFEKNRRFVHSCVDKIVRGKER